MESPLDSEIRVNGHFAYQKLSYCNFFLINCISIRVKLKYYNNVHCVPRIHDGHEDNKFERFVVR